MSRQLHCIVQQPSYSVVLLYPSKCPWPAESRAGKGQGNVPIPGWDFDTLCYIALDRPLTQDAT